MRLFLILIVIIFIPAIAFSQIVVVEGNMLSEDSLGWVGSVNLNLYNTKNTDNVITLSAGSVVQYRISKHRFVSLNNINFIQKLSNESSADENKGYQHLRYNYIFNKTWTMEAFAQGQFDQVLRIGFRGLLGAGPKVTVFKKEKGYMNVGLSMMYEHEQEKGNSIVHNDARANTYVSYQRQLGDNVSASLIGYYQPLVNDFSDFRVSSGFTFNVQFTKRFGFNLNAGLIYDAKPVVDEDIKKLTYSISNGISYNF